jgi:hypothetical protein
MKILYVICLIAIYKFLINLINWKKTENYLKEYEAYVENQSWEFHQNVKQITKLFKDAGLEDCKVPFVKPAGYGQIYTGSLSVMENLTNTKNRDILGNVKGLFYQTMGVYKNRTWQAFNPIYWVTVIIFLPQEILKYIGLDPEKAVIKTVQVCYWLLAVVVGFFYGVYKDSIDALIKNWISHLIK